MINFKCSCGKELKVPDTLARKVVTCNQCGRKNIQLPGPGEKLDLTDYELEDINEAGTIVLEPPSALSSIAPRKPLKNQPSRRTPAGKGGPAKSDSEARPRRLPRRNERPEPEPEPEPEAEAQEEFENEPARPARNTRRLEEKKQEAPTPRSERPSRRASAKKTRRDDDEIEDKSSLKAKSSQVVIETLTKLVEELKEDEQETVGEVKAARRDRSKRGDRSGDSRGSKSKRSRDDDDDYRDYGSSQKFLYVIIGAIVLIGVALFFYFKEPETKKPNVVATLPTVEQTKTPEKTAPKVEPPKYEKITEEGKRLLDLFEIKGENRDLIEKALEEKRVSSVNRKMSSKSYDSYIQKILDQKLAYVFAIHHILENVKFENEEHKFILYTIFSRINSVSDINGDRLLMSGLSINLNAPKIIWDREKVIAFLETTKNDFNNDITKVDIIKTPIDWKLIVEIVVSGKVEDDTTDIQLPQ